MTYRERRQAGFDRVSHEMATLNPPDKTQDVPQSRILRFNVDGVQIKLPYFRAKDGEMFMFQGCPCYTSAPLFHLSQGLRLVRTQRRMHCQTLIYCSRRAGRSESSSLARSMHVEHMRLLTGLLVLMKIGLSLWSTSDIFLRNATKVGIAKAICCIWSSLKMNKFVAGFAATAFILASM